MKLKTVSISGFRGFSSAVEIDLDADAIVLVGANGSGKTSFFDAILWAIAGTVPRLGTDESNILGRYSPSGEARVQVVLTTADGSTLDVRRRWDGTSHLSLSEDSSESLRGPAAQARLVERLWPDARTASDPSDALARALTRGVYLQQDLLRQFLDADDEQERFAVIGEIVGTGRIADLQHQLESGKASWTRATNVLATELEPLQTRRTAITDRLERLSGDSADADKAAAAWDTWSNRVGTYVAIPEVGGDPLEAARALDAALKELQAMQLQTDRDIGRANSLLEHLAIPVAEIPEIEPLRQAVAEAEQAAAEARERVRAAQEAAAEQRRRQTEERERSEELKALAQLALRHLDEHCPVCQQEYDIASTRARLERLLDETGGPVPEPVIDFTPVLAEVEQRERQVANATAELQRAEQVSRMVAEWRNTRARLVLDMALEDGTDLAERVRALVAALEQRRNELSSLRHDGDELSLRLGRVGEVAQRAELEQELGSLRGEIAAREAEIQSRTATGDLAAEILNALREATSDIVANELERIEPVLQRVYATVDPHPAFRAVRFLTRTVRGRGRLWMSIDDRPANVSVEEPATVLSSSQLNVLAVSVFLALNLAVETLPLDAMALDDPLQSLDDVNLLGLVDLLRRTKDRRQILGWRPSVRVKSSGRSSAWMRS